MTHEPRDRRYRILLGACGSAAALGLPQAVLWMNATVAESIIAVPSDASQRFVSPEALRMAGCTRVVSSWDELSDLGTDHVTLANWPDLVLVYPATANTIAKIAAGIADNVLTMIVLATEKPVFVAPSMSAAMWNKPVVRNNVATLQREGITVIWPSEGYSLASGRLEIGSPEKLEALFASVAELLHDK